MTLTDYNLNLRTFGDTSRPHSFTSHGRQYQVDEYGVIHQVDGQPFTYDANYVSIYDSEAYRRQNHILQAMRLGFTLAAHGSGIGSLLDYGYGNGAFLEFIGPQVTRRYGYDLTGVPVTGVQIVEALKWVDVITFWDALEHVPDLSFVADLPCETVVISLPFCHLRTMGQVWFDHDYRHRKPDEHLHHFDPLSLEAFMRAHHWQKVAASTHEDVVRISPGPWANILTMAFKR